MRTPTRSAASRRWRDSLQAISAFSPIRDKSWRLGTSASSADADVGGRSAGDEAEGHDRLVVFRFIVMSKVEGSRQPGDALATGLSPDLAGLLPCGVDGKDARLPLRARYRPSQIFCSG